jgi:hypothetical protein
MNIETLKTELEGKGVDELHKFAESRGYKVDKRFAPEKVLDAILRTEKQTHEDNLKKMKHQKKYRFKDDEMIEVLFQINDQTQRVLNVDYEGGSWDLESGREYELPESLIKHLANIDDPTYDYDPTAGEGMTITKSQIQRKRFQLTPVSFLERK